jgi:hypothetical protein
VTPGEKLPFIMGPLFEYQAARYGFTDLDKLQDDVGSQIVKFPQEVREVGVNKKVYTIFLPKGANRSPQNQYEVLCGIAGRTRALVQIKSVRDGGIV